MKVIENIELLKKLAPYLEDMETEYVVHKMSWEIILYDSCWVCDESYLKLLTLEEAIELLPYNNCITKIWYWYRVEDMSAHEELWKTLLEAIEKMLEYLLDNDLLWKKKEKS